MKGNISKELSNLSFIRLLKSFSKKEINDFEKFIASPFFNSQSTLVKIFSEIKKYYPEFSDKNFTKENLYEMVNPGKIYNDVIFRKYISNLLKLSEEFLVIIDNSAHNDRKLTSLLDQFERRNQFGLFQKLINMIDKKNISEDKITNESFYYKHFREELKSSINIRTNNLHLLRPNLIKSHIYLLLHLLLTSSVYSNMMLVNRKSFRDSEDIKFFEEFFEIFDIINYLEKTENLENSEKLFIELCKYEILLLKNPFDGKLLKSMKTVLLEISEYLNKNLQYIFFSHINIFYLINISNGKSEYVGELFENYKLMIESRLYFNGDKEFINFSEYRTILLNSLRLKEFKWAEEFIAKYRNNHALEMQENIYNFSMAYLKFEEKNFDDSLKYLSMLKVNDIIMKLDSDSLMMMIYFEKDYVDSALSMIDSFNYFIKSNEILSKDVKANQYDFIKYYKFLIKFKYSSVSSFDYNKMKNEISANNSVRRKSWLLEKLNSIKINKY